MVFYVSDMFFDNIKVSLNRHYSSVEDMNSDILERWNRVVSKDDTVYILGGVGNFEYIPSLNGSKILVMSDYERDTFMRYVESISDVRDEEIDYMMYETYRQETYGIKNLRASGKVIKKNYAGRIIRMQTGSVDKKNGIFNIAGAIGSYQRMFDNGINCNIFVNGMYPISDTEIEELIVKDKVLL